MRMNDPTYKLYKEAVKNNLFEKQAKEGDPINFMKPSYF